MRSFETTLNNQQKFVINLLILAKDDNETILAEKWQFSITQNPVEEIAQKIKEFQANKENNNDPYIDEGICKGILDKQIS